MREVRGMEQADVESRQNENAIELNFITAGAGGLENGYTHQAKIDVDIGKTNDFEITISIEEWKSGNYDVPGGRVFVPETEYGGLIEDIEVVTKDDAVILRGYTWRGLLTKKIIEPPDGEAYLYLSGDLNEVIGKLIGNRYEELFSVDSEETKITVNDWRVDRYVTLYDALKKVVENFGCRLNIRYVEGARTEPGKVVVGAVPIKDYSGELEYSQDAGINFAIRDCRNGINHLICGGAGDLEKRLILHLFAQQDGSIGTTQFYKGLSERVVFYDDNNADTPEKLWEGGSKRLAELQNYKRFKMSVENIDLEIGDIVGGREYVTGTELKKPVAQKIFRQANGIYSIEYKLEGED